MLKQAEVDVLVDAYRASARSAGYHVVTAENAGGGPEVRVELRIDGGRRGGGDLECLRKPVEDLVKAACAWRESMEGEPIAGTN